MGRINHATTETSSRILLLLQLLHAIVQRRDDGALRDAEAGRRRNVACAVRPNGRVLAAQAAHRQPQRLAHLLGLGVAAALGQVGQLDVHAGPHARAQVGRAARHAAVVARRRKLQPRALHHLQRRVQPVKHLVQQRALLHAHDAQVILLAHPDDEPAILRHVAAAPKRPVRCNAGRGQVRVGRHVLEHDVVLHQLLVLLVADLVRVALCQRVVAAAVLRHGLELVKRLAHALLQVDAVLLGHGPGQRELGQVAAHAHAHGQRRQPQLGQVQLPVRRQPRHALQAPVVDVLGVLADLVVARQHLAEERLEAVVVGRLHGVAAHARVRVLNAAAAHLQQALLVRVAQRVEVGHVKVLGHQVVGVRLLDSKNTGQRLSIRPSEGSLHGLLVQLYASIGRGRNTGNSGSSSSSGRSNSGGGAASGGRSRGSST
eukprot:m.211179 g.211179  ORF g.211179 m.211179 type:complete len:430 (+) comp22124_c0_seq11:782-2071(+)